MNSQEVSARYKGSRDEASTKCPDQREVIVVPIKHLIGRNTFSSCSYLLLLQKHAVICCVMLRYYVLMKGNIFHWLLVLYIQIVVAAIRGILKVEGLKGQVDDPVGRHLDGPHAVHAELIAVVQVRIRRPESTYGHGHVAPAALCWTCRQIRLFSLFFKAIVCELIRLTLYMLGVLALNSS